MPKDFNSNQVKQPTINGFLQINIKKFKLLLLYLTKSLLVIVAITAKHLLHVSIN